MATVQEYWDNMDMGKVQEILGMRKKQTPAEYYQEQLAKAQGIPSYEDTKFAPRTQGDRELAERCNLADQRMRDYTARVQAGRDKFWSGMKMG